MCSSERATRRKYQGAYVTAIDDEEIVKMEQATEKFAELRSKKVDSFTMILAQEPKPSKSMTRRAHDKLELPDFDLDENLREDYFTLGEGREDRSSLTDSQGTTKTEEGFVPTIGTKICKDFGSKGYFEGEVTEGPFIRTENGKDVTVWKVRYTDDGDREDMTAKEIASWKKPVDAVHASGHRLHRSRNRR